jgi:hypothetical protein
MTTITAEQLEPLTRYTEPEPALRLLIERLKLQLPAQPPPRITAGTAQSQTPM